MSNNEIGANIIDGGGMEVKFDRNLNDKDDYEDCMGADNPKINGSGGMDSKLYEFLFDLNVIWGHTYIT